MTAFANPKVYCCAKPWISRRRPTGHYLTQEHTRQRFRHAWSPGLLDRHDHKTWQDLGSTTLGERATARVDQLLCDHQPEPLPAEVRAALRRIVDARQASC